jgi:hypothetical protein
MLQKIFTGHGRKRRTKEGSSFCKILRCVETAQDTASATTFNCSLSSKLPPHKFANSTVPVSSSHHPPSYWRRSHEREIKAAGDEPSHCKLSIDRHKLALGLI